MIGSRRKSSTAPLGLLPDEAGHRRSSEVVGGHPKSSEVMRSNQRTGRVDVAKECPCASESLDGTAQPDVLLERRLEHGHAQVRQADPQAAVRVFKPFRQRHPAVVSAVLSAVLSAALSAVPVPREGRGWRLLAQDELDRRSTAQVDLTRPSSLRHRGRSRATADRRPSQPRRRAGKKGAVDVPRLECLGATFERFESIWSRCLGRWRLCDRRWL